MIKAPTETQTGERRFTCSDCNASYTESISKLPNNQQNETATSYAVSVSPNGGFSSGTNVIIKDSNGNIISGSNIYTIDENGNMVDQNGNVLDGSYLDRFAVGENGQLIQVLNSEASEDLTLSSCGSSISYVALSMLLLALTATIIILKKKRV